MKAISILFISMASLSISSCSQNIPGNKVPSVVQNTLKAKFPNALNIDWEWERKEKVFEVEFDLDIKEYTAFLDTAGNLIMYRTDIKVSELPAAVVSTIKQEYNNYEIDEAGKVEKDGMVYYIVELERKGEKDKKLLFSGDGRLEDKITYINNN